MCSRGRSQAEGTPSLEIKSQTFDLLELEDLSSPAASGFAEPQQQWSNRIGAHGDLRRFETDWRGDEFATDRQVERHRRAWR
jgi:hypothetical protein